MSNKTRFHFTICRVVLSERDNILTGDFVTRQNLSIRTAEHYELPDASPFNAVIEILSSSCRHSSISLADVDILQIRLPDNNIRRWSLSDVISL
jgi:hypothetical protein